MTYSFTIQCANDKIWNRLDLIKFLTSSQNKHIELRINPEAIDLAQLGIYDLLDCFNFASVIIFTENPLETSSKYKISIKKQNKFLEPHNLTTAHSNLHHWNLQKTFLACYGRPTANRLGLASYLDSHHADRSLLHFSGGHDVDNINLYELDKLAEFRLESVSDAVKLIHKMPVMITTNTEYDHSFYHFEDPLTECYKNIFIDIVSESHVLGNTFYATEKTTRPMCLKKPFIIYGPRNYLIYLRQMGFRTFNDFWSEDYDGYEGRDRFIKILELIDSLAKLPINELENMYWEMQYSLEHNYNLLSSQSYTTDITYIP